MLTLDDNLILILLISEKCQQDLELHSIVVEQFVPVRMGIIFNVNGQNSFCCLLVLRLKD